jgi:hypothetical protein
MNTAINMKQTVLQWQIMKAVTHKVSPTQGLADFPLSAPPTLPDLTATMGQVHPPPISIFYRCRLYLWGYITAQVH